MKKKLRKRKVSRLLSLLLVLVMIVSLVPATTMTALAADSNASLSTDKDTYEVGEPIMVTANSQTSGAWVGLYSDDASAGNGTNYWYWYYVNKNGYANGETYNIYETEYYTAYSGEQLPAGDYVLYLHGENDVKKNITIVEPDKKESSLEVENDTVTVGDPVRVKAVSYNDGAWIAVYSGTKSVTDTFGSEYGTNWCYTAGKNNTYVDFSLAAGDYTVVLFKDSGYSAEKVVNVTVEEGDKTFISTDKTEYKYGESIMVTTDYNGTSSWVGLYKKGETYDPDKGGVKSIYWYYLTEQDNPVDILKTRDENGRSGEYKAGEYTVVLFADGGYSPLDSVDITVTKEVVKETTVDATCEKDGSVTIEYSDGTTETQTIDKLGHKWGDWSYDGAEAKTHSRTCANDKEKNHIETEDCSFDDGVVTKEATLEENGEITYTCSVCKGTYTEEISKKEVKSEEVIKEATCEEEGTLRTTYTDGTYIDTVITKLGHKWSDWVYDAETKSHIRTCENDKNKDHVMTEDCDFAKDSIKDEKQVYVCKTCGGSYETALISTDKTEYKYGEPIMVTTDYMSDGAWAGIYKKGETYDPDTGGVKSIYWYYLTESPNPVDIRITRNENGRGGEFVAGEYTVVLFGDSGYNAIASVDITVTKEKVNETTVDPTCEKDGSYTIEYSDGTKDVTTIEKLGHKWGECTYDAKTKTHVFVCENDENHTKSEDCTFDEGVVTKEATEEENGEITYTCSVCKGTYTEETSVKVVKSETVVKEPTCEEEGVLKVEYEDGSVIEKPIKKLGHNYGDWVYDAETKTHSKTCKNDSAHVVKEDCTFGEGEKADGKVTYTCEVCRGTYDVTNLSTNKDKYTVDEELKVTAICENDLSWVGLYKIDDKYDKQAGGVVSFYWFYVVDKANGINRSGQEINLFAKEFKNIERLEGLSSGEYKVVLFGDSGYDNVIATKEIVIETDTDDTVFDVSLNGTSMKNGEIAEFTLDDTVKLTVTPDGSAGNSWVGLYNKKVGTDMDFSSNPSSYWYYIKDNNGVEINLTKEASLTVGDYSLVLFGNDGYDDIRTIVYFTIEQKADNTEIIKEPTCTEYGIQKVTYEDGTESFIPINPLGHDYEGKKWEFDKETKTHCMTCNRCDEELVADCTFGEAEIVEEATAEKAGTKKYTCEVCEGIYTEEYHLENAKDTNVYRIFGDTRYETAFKIADELKKLKGVEKFDTIIVASGNEFADALAGSYLAYVKEAPILMVNNKKMDAVKAYVNENIASGGTVYILGGTKAVSEDMEKGLNDCTVKRLWGDTRYETNIEILKEADVKDEEMIVCTGKDFADSLSASAAKLPILLVKSKLTDGQKTYLATLSGQKFDIIGGTSAVTTSIESELRNYRATERIGGRTRYETSVLVAERFCADSEKAVLAYSVNYPDGLCGGPLAISMNAPLILTKTNKESAAAEYAKESGITYGTVLGGDGLIADDTVRTIFGMNAEDKIVVVE